jgi:hypothetical protein
MVSTVPASEPTKEGEKMPELENKIAQELATAVVKLVELSASGPKDKTRWCAQQIEETLSLLPDNVRKTVKALAIVTLARQCRPGFIAKLWEEKLSS